MRTCWGMKTDSFHHYRLQNVILNIPFDELKKRIRLVDIIGLDVDNCLIAGHGQIHIGIKLLPDIMLEAFMGFPAMFFTKVCAGVCGLCFFKLKKLLGTDSFNLFIMKCFAHTLKGISKDAFDEAVEDFRRLMRPGAEEAMQFLANSSPLVLLSLGLEPVARWLRDRIKDCDTVHRIVVHANPVHFKKDGKSMVFTGYAGYPKIKNGEDKLNLLVREAERVGARTPMVIGHDENDLEMVKWTRNRRGVTIGFAPKKRYSGLFDVVVLEPSWYSLIEFFGACLA